APSLGHQIDALSGSAREDDFVCAHCTDVFLNTLPRLFVSFCRPRTQSMQSTMDICILMFIEIPKRLDHHTRLLRGCRAIEIDQRMAMRLFAEYREILAKALPIYGGVRNLVHPIICSAHGNALLYLKTNEVSVTAARRWNALSSARRLSYCGFATRFSCAFSDCLNHRLRRSRSTLARMSVYRYFNSWFTSAKALTANSKSSRECAADTCVRIRAVPCGTTGKKKPMT